jgi:phosphopantetheinyl transferase
VAISNVPVGIDAEPFSRAVELKDIAPRILTKVEAQKWPDVPTQLDLELALQHWVGKEAYLKGVGAACKSIPSGSRLYRSVEVGWRGCSEGR